MEPPSAQGYDPLKKFLLKFSLGKPVELNSKPRLGVSWNYRILYHQGTTSYLLRYAPSKIKS